MSQNKTVCDECGHEIDFGEWPWCPHEKSVIRHKPFEPYLDITVHTEPVWITSAHQRFKYMNKNALKMRTRPEDKRLKRPVQFFLSDKFGK